MDDKIIEYSLKHHMRQGKTIKLCLLMIFIMTLAACGGSPPPSSDEPLPTMPGQSKDPQVSETESESVPEPDEDQILILWRESGHAESFVLDENDKNSTCARCHAPVNWLPSMDDMPESCLVCKFEVDQPPPVIPENEWTHIECKVCHEYKKDKLQPEVAWLEIAAIEEYAEVESTIELCEKCHLAGDIQSHNSILVGGDHTGFACVDCHDAHSNQASCGDEACHLVLMDGSDAVVGHDQEHAMVSCSACHDGTGLDVGPDDESGLWLTYLAQTGISMTSHSTQMVVDCTRCHYADNPWDLSAEVEQ